MWLSQRQFRRVAVLVSIGAAIATVGAGLVGIWLIYELSSGAERRGLAIAAEAPYSPAKNLTKIVQAPPNKPTDGRDPWQGKEVVDGQVVDYWTKGVQAGNQYITQFPQPQNTQVLTGMTTAQVWSFMQQQVSGALGVGCEYCHNVNPGPDGKYQFNLDTIPQKVAARNMMKLVNDLNRMYITNLPYWRGNYVTCSTCHSGTGNGNGVPLQLEAVSDQFVYTTPPIPVTVEILDKTGQPIRDREKKPDYVKNPVPLKDAVLFDLYHYQVWKPYDPRDSKSGRGSLALVYNGGRTQDQVNITQGTMNLIAWSLGVGCTYCHNARNFYSYEITTDSPTFVGDIPQLQGKHIAPRLKAQRMLLMTTYIAENWDKYGAIAKTDKPADTLVGKVFYRKINGKVYNVPGCYTCHGRVSIPKSVINNTTLTASKQPETILPPVLRGQK